MSVVMTTGQVHGVELTIVPDDQPARNVVVHGRRIQAEDGAVLGGVIAVHDVTALKRHEAELEAAVTALADEREFEAAVLEVINAGVVACDADGNVVVRNATQRDFTGVPDVPRRLSAAGEANLQMRSADGQEIRAGQLAAAPRPGRRGDRRPARTPRPGRPARARRDRHGQAHPRRGRAAARRGVGLHRRHRPVGRAGGADQERGIPRRRARRQSRPHLHRRRPERRGRVVLPQPRGHARLQRAADPGHGRGDGHAAGTPGRPRPAACRSDRGPESCRRRGPADALPDQGPGRAVPLALPAGHAVLPGRRRQRAATAGRGSRRHRRRRHRGPADRRRAARSADRSAQPAPACPTGSAWPCAVRPVPARNWPYCSATSTGSRTSTTPPGTRPATRC